MLLALSKLSIETETPLFAAAGAGAAFLEATFAGAALAVLVLVVFFFLPIEVDRMVLMKAGVTSTPAFFSSAEISFGLAFGFAA